MTTNYSLDKPTELSYIIDKADLLYKEFNYVISIGHRCTSAIAIRNANMRDAAYPFDWCASINSYNVLNAIKNKFEDFLPEGLNGLCNKYGIILVHLDKNDSMQNNHEKYIKRCNRFINILKSDKTILFVYANEDYIYSKQYRDGGSDNIYKGVQEINNYFRLEYPNLKFQIMYIDSKFRNSTNEIIHTCINIPSNLLTDDTKSAETTFTKYRNLVGNILINAGFKYTSTF